jgi:hypothetical protein
MLEEFDKRFSFFSIIIPFNMVANLFVLWSPEDCCQSLIDVVFILLALTLSFESGAEQLSWLKQFERSGVKTGETEEVQYNVHLYRAADNWFLHWYFSCFVITYSYLSSSSL